MAVSDRDGIYYELEFFDVVFMHGQVRKSNPFHVDRTGIFFPIGYCDISCFCIGCRSIITHQSSVCTKRMKIERERERDFELNRIMRLFRYCGLRFNLPGRIRNRRATTNERLVTFEREIRPSFIHHSISTHR